MKHSNKAPRTMLLVLLLVISACGGSGVSATKPKRLSQAGEFTVSASMGHEASFPLVVDYAVAGLTSCNKTTNTKKKGALIVFDVFGNGQINSQLDLSTISLSIDMDDLSSKNGGALFDFQRDPVPIYLESWEEGTSRLISLEAGTFSGSLELRYATPLAPGSTLEGSLSLVVPHLPTQSLGFKHFTLDGFFQVPVFGNCN